ncbi:27917_t:CDS:1, partial [Gigaspora margarita]
MPNPITIINRLKVGHYITPTGDQKYSNEVRVYEKGLQSLKWIKIYDYLLKWSQTTI